MMGPPFADEPPDLIERISAWEADTARTEEVLKQQAANVAALAHLPEEIRDALRTKHSMERQLAHEEKRPRFLNWRSIFRKH